jgi:hypothetical protein
MSRTEETIMRRLTLVVALAAGAMATTALADHEVTHPFTQSTPMQGVRRVVLDIPAGEFHFSNGAGKTLAIRGSVRRDYEGWTRRDQNQRIVDDVAPEIVIKGDQAIIRRRFGANATGWSARNKSTFDMTIEVPSGADIDVQTRFGEVHFDGAFGNVNVDMNAGEIHMTTPRANVRELAASCRAGEVHTNTGSEIIDHEGLFPRTTRYTNPHGGKGEVRLHVTFGEVHVKLTT